MNNVEHPKTDIKSSEFGYLLPSKGSGESRVNYVVGYVYVLGSFYEYVHVL